MCRHLRLHLAWFHGSPRVRAQRSGPGKANANVGSLRAKRGRIPRTSGSNSVGENIRTLRCVKFGVVTAHRQNLAVWKECRRATCGL